MKKILVPMDGSDSSKKALKTAIKLAEQMDSSIKVIHVIPPIVSKSVYAYTVASDKTNLDDALKISNKNSKNMLDDALAPYKDFKGDLSATTIIGNPPEEIIREAEDQNYDLIIMGSRGLGAFTRTLLGSVSDRVVYHSKVSVLITK